VPFAFCDASNTPEPAGYDRGGRVVNFRPWPDWLKDLLRWQLRTRLEPCCGVDLVELPVPNLNCVACYAGDFAGTLSGFGGVEFSWYRGGDHNRFQRSAVYVNTAGGAAFLDPAQHEPLKRNSYYDRVFMHEFLHALGLPHPGDDAGAASGSGCFLLPDREDSTLFSIMSYDRAWFGSTSPARYYGNGPGWYDKLALIDRYGARPGAPRY
jgi:hypothetical protein